MHVDWKPEEVDINHWYMDSLACNWDCIHAWFKKWLQITTLENLLAYSYMQ